MSINKVEAKCEGGETEKIEWVPPGGSNGVKLTMVRRTFCSLFRVISSSIRVSSISVALVGLGFEFIIRMLLPLFYFTKGQYIKIESTQVFNRSEQAPVTLSRDLSVYLLHSLQTSRLTF